MKSKRFIFDAARKTIGSRFVRNVAVVASGTAAAQAITIGFSPVVTRMYGPEAFGVLGTFTSVLGVLAPVAALSYPIALVLPERDSDARALIRLSLRIAVVTASFAGLVLFSAKSSIVELLSLHSIEPFLLLFPIAMLFSAALAVASQWIIRKKLFRVKAKIAVVQALWLNTAKVLVGFLYIPTASVLVILATLASALHASMLWFGVRAERGRNGANANPNEGEETFSGLAWKYKDFAYYRTPQVLLNAASQSVPVLMLASFGGAATAGFYTLGRMVLGAPSALIGQSVSSVFYPRITEAVRDGENAKGILVKATLALAVLGVLPFGLIVAFGPWLFTTVFGDEWRMAGIYAQWLALWSYFGFMNRPSVSAIAVLSLQGFYLCYEIVSVVLRLASLAAGFLIFDSALAAVALFSFISVILNALLVLVTLFAAPGNARDSTDV